MTKGNGHNGADVIPFPVEFRPPGPADFLVDEMGRPLTFTAEPELSVRSGSQVFSEWRRLVREQEEALQALERLQALLDGPPGALWEFRTKHRRKGRPSKLQLAKLRQLTQADVRSVNDRMEAREQRIGQIEAMVREAIAEVVRQDGIEAGLQAYRQGLPVQMLPPEVVAELRRQAGADEGEGEGA